MNLADFEKTTQSGLYLSKEEHTTFGKKYIARFQHEKKRYVKVLINMFILSSCIFKRYIPSIYYMIIINS